MLLLVFQNSTSFSIRSASNSQTLNRTHTEPQRQVLSEQASQAVSSNPDLAARQHPKRLRVHKSGNAESKSASSDAVNNTKLHQLNKGLLAENQYQTGIEQR